MPSMSSDYAKNRAMKSKKAEEILSASSITDSCGYEYLLTSCAKRAVEIAEQEIEEKLTRWNDPKEVLPKNGECVLIKVVDQLDNEALYMGSWEGDRYITDFGLVFGNDFDDESVPDMNIKAIGWREIM